jgi:hypothetical protein
LYLNPSKNADTVPLLPARFWCSGSYQWRGGSGHLTVAPSALTFEFDEITRRAFRNLPTITHRGSTVTAVHARLAPPMLNVGIVLRGDTGAVAVTMWSWFQFPRVRAALEKAEFVIEDVTRWFSRGEQLARTWTREQRAGSGTRAR